MTQARVRQSIASAPFEFDVVADPELPMPMAIRCARLLPLMKKNWWWTAPTANPKLNPGANRA